MKRTRVLHLPHGFGITLADNFLRPNFDHWPGYWFACALGVCVWRDTSKPVTVGERGVW